MRGARFLNRLEPSGGVAERRDNAPALGEQVRHIERLVIHGYGLADPTGLVIEPINTGLARTQVTREVTGNIALSMASRNPLTLSLMI
jgi:hypothetical protein